MLSIGPEAALPGSRKRPDNCICQTHQSLEGSLRVCTGQVMSRQPCKVLYGSMYRGVAAVRFIRSAAMMSGVKKLSRVRPGERTIQSGSPLPRPLQPVSSFRPGAGTSSKCRRKKSVI